jgi:DNA (cytosine-5)-methyltransferase 1
MMESKVYQDRIEDTLSGPKPRTIDLFSGSGGLTAGFSEIFGHRFEPVWAIDNDESAVDSYKANFGNVCVFADIVDYLKNKKDLIPKADLVIGGPPCQGFSLLNRNRENDSRKSLWSPFMEIVKLSEAKVFLIENVPQLIGSEEQEKIENMAKKLGFRTYSDILLAADYGVPQLRKRAFIIGCKYLDPKDFFPPLKTHYKPGNGNYEKTVYIDNPSKWETVRDAIFDLGKPKGTQIRQEQPPLDLHFGRNPTEKSIKRYKAIPEEGMNRFDLERNAPEITPECWKRKKSGGTDLFGRLWWDKPSLTIRTEFFKPEKGRYLHPEQHRPITHREAARLQTYPDSFIFKGSKIQIARQIGNSVPPLLASRLADSIYSIFLAEEKVNGRKR